MTRTDFLFSSLSVILLFFFFWITQIQHGPTHTRPTVLLLQNNSQRICEFDSDPAIGVNPDGTLELFVRFKTNLDMWKFDLKNATDPMSWSTPRETSCVDQDQNTALWYCIGEKVGTFGNPASHYWVGQPVFPTSNPTVINDPVDGRIVVYFRGFEGRLYEVHQITPGDGSKYSMPSAVSNRIIE